MVGHANAATNLATSLAGIRYYMQAWPHMYFCSPFTPPLHPLYTPLHPLTTPATVCRCGWCTVGPQPKPQPQPQPQPPTPNPNPKPRTSPSLTLSLAPTPSLILTLALTPNPTSTIPVRNCWRATRTRSPSSPWLSHAPCSSSVGPPKTAAHAPSQARGQAAATLCAACAAASGSRDAGRARRRERISTTHSTTQGRRTTGTPCGWVTGSIRAFHSGMLDQW